MNTIFLEFDGATASMDDDNNLVFNPRGKIYIQLQNIGGYYDHTLLLMGNKIRVMDTAEQITAKILEATT